MNFRIRTPFYIFLNPDYVAARSLRKRLNFITKNRQPNARKGKKQNREPQEIPKPTNRISFIVQNPKTRLRKNKRNRKTQWDPTCPPVNSELFSSLPKQICVTLTPAN